jgi:ABC-type dipeptide/oligopeptide/nickel transport system ATPase component
VQLQSVSICGFRSIRELPDLVLGSPTVLAGHNDAGKSAIIHAILFLLDGYSLTESDRTYDSSADGTVSREPDGSIKRVEETHVAGTFGLDENEAERFGALCLQIRRVARNGAKPTLEVMRSVPTDARLRGFDALTAQQLLDRLTTLGLDASKGNKPDYLERLENAANSAAQSNEWVAADSALSKALPAGRRFDATSAVDAEIAIKDTLTTAYKAHLDSDTLQGRVRAIETDLEKLLIDDAEEIRQHIMGKVSDIGDVRIKPAVSFTSANGLKSTDITVHNQAGEPIDLQLSGAGRARRVALAIWEYNATLLAQSGEDIVLLYDEPDTHLDYGHQRELMSLIHEQTKNPKVTVVIASHSMNLIDGTDISDVVHVKHEQHRTVIERLADDSEVGSHLGAIAASVGLRNTVLLHERLFVGVEGESEARALPVLFKLATGRHFESCGIAIWPCGNNEGARHFAGFLHSHQRNVVFLVDEDSRTNAKHVFSPVKLRAAGLDPETQCLYIGDPAEIEEIFTDEQWAAAANQSWPRDDSDTQTWSAADFASHRGGKFSRDILEMIRTNATVAPTGKPDMLVGLALSLKSVNDVPQDLREKFAHLVKLAK